MGLKSKLLVFALVSGLAAYWLYCPVPDGFSPASTRKLRFIFANIKFLDAVIVAANRLGYGTSYGNAHRRITSGIIGLIEKKGADPEIKETDDIFDGVPVRIYEPVNRKGVLPGVIWYHGGGYMLGFIDGFADIHRKFCKQANAVVVAVDYRLTPDHVYPAGFEDALASTKYFITNAKKYNVDPARIALGGDSAGGNFAAAISLKLRDTSFTPVNKLQVLIYPHLQSLTTQLPSILENADGPLLTRAMIGYFTSMYFYGNDDQAELILRDDHVSTAVKKKGLPIIDIKKLPAKYLVGYRKLHGVESGNETVWNELKDRLLSPYFSPLMAKKLEGLPPAYVFTAEHDTIRDEGLLFVARLREAGVKVKHLHSDIAFHSIIWFAQFIPEGDAILQDAIKFVAENL